MCVCVLILPTSNNELPNEGGLIVVNMVIVLIVFNNRKQHQMLLNSKNISLDRIQSPSETYNYIVTDERDFS